MRKKVILFFIIGVCVSVYADQFWITTHQDQHLGFYQDSSVYFEYASPRNPVGVYRMFQNNKKNENGYFYIQLNSSSQKKDEIDRIYILEGKGLIMRSFSTSNKRKETVKVTKKDIFDWILKKKKSTKRRSVFDTSYNIFDSGISSVLSSSFLNENGIYYVADYILEKVLITETEDWTYLEYDSLTPPWVEGVEGYGIGEHLDIEFKYASDELQILNGFVDFGRMHLYKDNSRVKRILIESEEPAFTQEYELEDVVRYNVITLPKKTTKIRMTILDVYPGRKWKDTCISSILVTDPDQPPYEEQKAKIIALMKENGVWEEIEEFKKKLRDEAQ